MRYRFIAAAALGLAACTPPANTTAPMPQAVTVDAPSGEYLLDKSHASLVVRATHLGLSHYTLRLTGLDATLTFNAEDPALSSVRATIAADSVSTEFQGPRDFNDELENSEWLDAATHAAITFNSTGVELTGANTGRMTGDLTVRGATHPAVLDVTFNRAYRQHPFGRPGALLGFSARGTILRSAYGLNALLPAGADGVGISDEVEIVIEAEFTQLPAPASPVN
jgi:polyisoprenoid-binding protein YceI